MEPGGEPEYARKNAVSLKEKYRLWVEYLKRHEGLISFLKSIKEKEKGISIKPFSSKTAEGFIKKIYQEYGRRLFNKDTLRYFQTWDNFGKVVRGDENFDDWWKSWKEIETSFKSVEDYFKSPERSVKCLFDEHFATATAKMKLSSKEIELLLKFKKVFSNVIQANLHESFLSVVHLCFDKNNEELTEDFLTLVGNKRKEARLNKKSLVYKKGQYPLEPFYSKDLARYLRVYDLRKKGNKYPEIQRIIEKEFGPRSSYPRTLPEDFKIANQIIENAALGLFPLYGRKRNKQGFDYTPSKNKIISPLAVRAFAKEAFPLLPESPYYHNP